MTTAQEDDVYTYTAVGTDMDTERYLHTRQLESVPAWTNIHSILLEYLQEHLANSDVGTPSVTLTVTDAAGAVGTQTFTITVSNANDAPSSHQHSSNTSATEDAVYTYTLTAADADVGDTLTMSWNNRAKLANIHCKHWCANRNTDQRRCRNEQDTQ